MILAFDFTQIPEKWVTGIALAASGALSWAVQYVTNRSREKALAMRDEAAKKADNEASLSNRAFTTLETLVDKLQGEVSHAALKVERIEREYGARIARVERRNNKMHHFIVKLLDAYLQIKAYVLVLETMVCATNKDWKCRTFPEMELPTFDDDPPIVEHPVLKPHV